MINLLQETEDVLAAHGKTWDDIDYVMCQDSVFYHPATIKPMFDFAYNNGFGGEEVDLTLKIVGSDITGDWWMERGEYDGSEWWEFKQMPKPTQNKPYHFVTFKNHNLYEPERYDDYIEEISRRLKEIE